MRPNCEFYIKQNRYDQNRHNAENSIYNSCKLRFVGVAVSIVIKAIKFSVYFTDNIVAVRDVKFFSVSFNICNVHTFGNVGRTIHFYFMGKTAYLHSI